MEITKFLQKSSEPVIVCLGGFDSVHKGHKSIIKKAVKLKKRFNCKLAVITISECENGESVKDGKEVFTVAERAEIMRHLQVDELINCVFTKEFANKTALEFLNELCDNRAIRAFVCGKDYRFGNKGAGDVRLLERYCKQKRILLRLVKFKRDFLKRKISTTKIKQCLAHGDVEQAEMLLGGKYFVTGLVEHGRGEGHQMGIPTANIIPETNKIALKNGVYYTKILIDGKKYKALTNYGAAPTFGVEKTLIESHIINFCGELYGKQITVFFEKYLRPIYKFENEEQLKQQINKDLEAIK